MILYRDFIHGLHPEHWTFVAQIYAIPSGFELSVGALAPNCTFMTIYFHEEDLPAGVLTTGDIAIDTETMGLDPNRDRLCVVQLSDGSGDEHLVRFSPGSSYDAPNLRAILTNPEQVKLFHFGRFDIAMMEKYLGVRTTPVYCTKIASRLVRTYTDRHGLKELCREILGCRSVQTTAIIRLGRS